MRRLDRHLRPPTDNAAYRAPVRLAGGEISVAAHALDSTAECDPAPSREARIAYSDQAATNAKISGVVRESAAYQDAAANGKL